MTISVRSHTAHSAAHAAVSAAHDSGPDATAPAVQAGKKQRGIVHYIGVGLSAGVFAVVIALAAMLIVVPWITGATPMTILTSSMEPHLPPGTLIVVKPEPINDIRIGDVMTYQIESGKPAVVSHRVTSESTSTDGSRTFITKGDNNAVADANPVVAGQVKGVVWYSIPFVGYVNTAINGPDRAWIVPIMSVALFGYAGIMVVAGLVDARKKRRAAAVEQVTVVE
ncbi:MAG TPA: signal peptidase I [Microbacteriaceae bacterium]|nr:signal peptidase I [Microbacteriaceae bacterium]